MSHNNIFLRLLGRFSRKATEDPVQVAKLRRTAAGSEFDEFTSPWSHPGGIPVNLRSIRCLFRDADSGSPGELAGLFARLQEYDPNLVAHLQTRFLSVLACDWRIEGEDSARVADAEKVFSTADRIAGGLDDLSDRIRALLARTRFCRSGKDQRSTTADKQSAG